MWLWKSFGILKRLTSNYHPQNYEELHIQLQIQLYYIVKLMQIGQKEREATPWLNWLTCEPAIKWVDVQTPVSI